MTVVYLLLLVAAAVCFLLTAFASRRGARYNLLALGLLAWVLVPLIQTMVQVL